jgi:hypothetical protein
VVNTCPSASWPAVTYSLEYRPLLDTVFTSQQLNPKRLIDRFFRKVIWLGHTLRGWG